MQRLHLASAIAGRVGVETQVLEAGAALDESELGIVEPVDVAECRTKLVERQRSATCRSTSRRLSLSWVTAKPTAAQTIIAPARKHRQERRNARGSCILPSRGGRARRLARTPPVCRPPFPGCRSGRHTHAPSGNRRAQISCRMINGKERPGRACAFQQRPGSPFIVNMTLIAAPRNVSLRGVVPARWNPTGYRQWGMRVFGRRLLFFLRLLSARPSAWLARLSPPCRRGARLPGQSRRARDEPRARPGTRRADAGRP